MAGVKADPRTVQLFQLTCWPMGHKVPTSTNSLVELMNMVERWRQRTDYGCVAVVSPYVLWVFLIVVGLHYEKSAIYICFINMSALKLHMLFSTTLER